MTIEAGSQAPDAHFLMPDGSTARISDFAGKPFVLYFYPKDDTTGCTREAIDFSGLAGEFAAIGVPVVGASKDSLARHAKFTAKHDLKVILVSDGDGSLCEAFGTWVTKTMYGKDYLGIERATFLIDAAGQVVRVWRKVRVAGHAQEVLESAKALAG